MRTQALAVLAAMLGLALPSCSLDEPTPPDQTAGRTTETKQQPSEPPEQEFLTRADLEKYPRGSPERAVFDFWFQIQYRDLLSAYESLAPEFRAEFAGSLQRFGNHVMADYARWLTKPRVLFVRAEADEATVALAYRNIAGVEERSSFSLLRTRARSNAPRDSRRRGSAPTATWTVAYDFYLANLLTAN